MTRVIYKRGPSPPPFPAPDEQKWEGGGDKVSEGKRRRETGDQGQTTVVDHRGSFPYKSRISSIQLFDYCKIVFTIFNSRK